MNIRLENKVSMYFTLRAFFSHQLATLTATVPILPTQVSIFNTQLDELGNYIIAGTETTTGYAMDKQNHRIAMRDSALAISGALYAHASIVADDELQAKTKLSKGYIDQKRDTDILYWAERISSLAAQHAAALLPMGIGAPLLANLATSVEAFRSNLSEPTERRSTANAALAKADMQVALIDKNLEIIDALMQAASLSHSQLYFEYQLDRKIIDNR